jgi:hypothetical protein
MWRWFIKFDPAARYRIVRGIVAVGIGASFLASLVGAGARDAATRIYKPRQTASKLYRG